MTQISFLGGTFSTNSFWDDFFDVSKQGFDAAKILKEIGDNLKKSNCCFYPDTKDKILDIFNKDFTDAKYIIMVQDPYATYCNKGCYATGRAIEMAFMNQWKDLMDNEYGNTLKEVMRSIFRCTSEDLPSNLVKMKITPTEWFDQSEKEGVIWINSALTVKSSRIALRGERQQYEEWDKIMPKIVAYIFNKAPNLKEAIALGDHADKMLNEGFSLYNNSQNNIKTNPITKVDHPTSANTKFYDLDIFSKMKNDIESFDPQKII